MYAEFPTTSKLGVVLWSRFILFDLRVLKALYILTDKRQGFALWGRNCTIV